MTLADIALFAYTHVADEAGYRLADFPGDLRLGGGVQAPAVVLTDHVAVAPTRREAFRFWLKLGLISFGGPVAQIAIMHRELVDVRRWIDERTFMNALNFAVLLPGPEALQLAVWLGWRLHGVWGGVVAWLCFLLPSVILLFALSFIYAMHGDVPVIAAALHGLKAVAIALIVQALFRIGRRALQGAAARRARRGRARADGRSRRCRFRSWSARRSSVRSPAAMRMRQRRPRSRQCASRGGRSRRASCCGSCPRSRCSRSRAASRCIVEIYRFFTTAALVTFGGAYAVLAWVNQQAVEVYGWLTQADTIAGLALAETTPGPLIIVLQFVGFMTGWNQPGPAGPAFTATITALLTSWAMFLPAFVLILVGAPYVEKVTSNARLSAALACITAAVVGVVGSLAIAFGRNVLFPQGIGQPDWPAIVIAALAFAVLSGRGSTCSGSSPAASWPASRSASSDAAAVLA